ncbi:phage antirepressor [Paenibacillus sp. HJGM_3]|uniref:phage antirepressor n=1 Tax=Paenibacillus sp. HJGM_3 TaxID=3379816 RepID=UPI003858E316
MDNQLMLFEGEHEVVILFKNDVMFQFKGDFLIRVKDVSSILGYERSENVVKLCKPEQVFKVKNSDFANTAKTKLNNTGETFITNLALNRVLGKSEMPKAAPFQDWLYEEMIPSVQKHGAYLTSDKIEEVLTNPDTLIKLATAMKEERDRRIEAEKKALQYEDKAKYVDIILQSKGLVTTTQIAKDYGLSGAELNKILKDLGIQYQVNKQWVLYAKYADKGYTQSYSFPIKHKDGTPDIVMNTQWTQRGRLFIHENLTRLGIKANIDKEYGDAK